MDIKPAVAAPPTSGKILMLGAFAGLFLYGAMTAFPGAAMPLLQARLAISPALCGLLFSLLYLPQIPVVFGAGPLIDRFGARSAFILGSALCAAGFAGGGVTSSYSLLAASILVLGVGGGLLSSASNTLVADLFPQNPAPALNVGHGLFGLGAIFFPLALMLTENRMGVLPSLASTTALSGIIAILALTCRFPGRRADKAIAWHAVAGTITQPAVLILSLIAFLTTGLAVSISGWLRLYLQQQFTASARVSGLALALFWGLIMAARFLSPAALRKVQGPRLVLWCSVGLLLGLLVLTMAPNPAMAVAGVVACGISYGPIYPTTVASAGRHFHQYFATVFGCLQAAGLLGGMMFPAAIGWVARSAAIGVGFWLLVAAGILLVALQTTFVRHERRALNLEGRS